MPLIVVEAVRRLRYNLFRRLIGLWSCSIKLLRYFTVRCSVLVYKPTLCNFLNAEPREGALSVTIALGSPNCLWSRFKKA